ncbi:hypothetical protein IPH92_02640 [Candidatus Kaiserbacteria bacterium]|nr:MAG: hypothetical protein IPH92_02640 [Candidatus Kaiserbacteria bacterium]
MTCVITNTYNGGGNGDPDKGTIIIQKQTIPDGNQTLFTFNPSWSDVDFTLSDGGQSTSSKLATGTYSVVESPITGWTQTSAVCSDGSPINAIALQSGETVTCVVTNTLNGDTGGGEKGTIIIEKQTLPDGNQTVFTFNPSWSEVNFTLSDGGQHTQSGLAVGVYNVVETLETNWTQTSAVCSDGSPITAISLQANETVTCVITNTLDGGGENTVPKWLVFGYVWHDENENDAWDVEQPNPVDDESDLDGWTVQITNGGVTYSTTTDASGYYYFYVPAGTWTINEIIEEGWSKTFPNVNGHVVEVLGEVTFSEETHFFAKLMDFVVPTAYASVLPTTYGPYNFGNVQEDDSSSSGSDGSGPRRGSRRHSSNNNDDEPEGEVLGESTSIMPIGAPNTGAGGTAPHAVQFPILTAILPLSTSVRKVKNG